MPVEPDTELARIVGISRSAPLRNSAVKLRGTTRSGLGMIERCENSPTVDMLERLARALQVEPSILLARNS